MTTTETKVIPLIKEYKTAKEQAEYFFNREFDCVSLELLKDDCGLYEYERPSINKIIDDWFNDVEDKDEYIKEYLETVNNEFNEDEFNDWIEDNNDFQDYKYGDWEMNNHPMWGYVFKAPEFYINSSYCDVDKLYDLGIGVIDHETGYYLFICGAGYDFYEAHWIPLFKMLGWIKEEK